MMGDIIYHTQAKKKVFCGEKEAKIHMWHRWHVPRARARIVYILF